MAALVGIEGRFLRTGSFLAMQSWENPSPARKVSSAQGKVSYHFHRFRDRSGKFPIGTVSCARGGVGTTSVCKTAPMLNFTLPIQRCKKL